MLGLFKRRTVAIPDELWSANVGALRLLDARPPAQLQALREHVGRFLATKAITPARELALDDAQRLVIASLCCLPVLDLGVDALSGWHEVIVYPGQFRVRRHDHDAETSVVSEWDDELAGESWSHGPIVLSWADIEQDLRDPFEGLNVVIHEIAHKLDMADGESDGIPPMAGSLRREFKRVMSAAYEALVVDVDAERETLIDPYAAESPDEYFAVLSEYYFSAPDVLAEHYREVFEVLRGFYGEVPLPALAIVRP